MKRLFNFLILTFAIGPLFASYTYTIKEGDNIEQLTLRNSESLLMTGGCIGDLTLLDQSVAYFRNEIPEYQFTMFFLRVGGKSIAEIDGGRIYTCFSGFESNINMYSGELGWIRANHNSPIHIYGGNIYDYLKVEGGAPAFHVYGYNLTISILEYKDQLTGYWADGSKINIPLYRDQWTGINTRDYMILHEIPEPATLMLLGLGGLLFRRK